jgi:putative Mn2+ efflux pump MntP
LVITGITTAVCLVGFFLGKVISKALKGRYSIANVIGGVILIAIGVSIVIEHMTA